MNVIDLVILVCALAGGGKCEERHLLVESHGSLEACMMQAQPYLAQWIGEHPKLRIAAFHCAWPETEKQGI
jgi:hypothetical protein